ncbi:hypothetical protein PA01_11605 [Azoarcus sp. PA01]|nr:hypothetical protein PA01_11605 [Azoarcus sp. PA01]
MSSDSHRSAAPTRPLRPPDAAADDRTGRGLGRYLRGWLLLFWCSAFAAVVLGATLVPHFSDSAELVRMRNALLFDSLPASHEWTPADPPADFAIENRPPNPLYAGVVARGNFRAEDGDWVTALGIARHLLAGGRRNGGAIQSDLDETYRRITSHADGYCGDFADVFTGLASAAGVFSRPWAFSFDGFGGRGHIFNEIWDRAERRWIMIDVFNNMYFTGDDGRPLSAAELHAALQRGSPLRVVPIAAAARPGFKYDVKAIDYYRRGLPEWYMWWGNNVFEYDQAILVRLFGRVSRSLEQIGGIAQGAHPHIRVLQDDANLSQVAAIQRLKWRIFAFLGALLVALFSVVMYLKRARRARREGDLARSESAPHASDSLVD